MAERRFNWLLVLPPALFIVLLLAFVYGNFRENRDELPSMLEGAAAPVLDLPALMDTVPAPGPDTLTAPGVKLVNFWASWCGPCRVEHPTLTQLAREGITIIGVNYKDSPENGRGFLEELGNPYAALGTDETGRTGINWGIYGVPETFVIDGEGRIILRFPGPITQRELKERVGPAIRAAGGEIALD